MLGNGLLALLRFPFSLEPQAAAEKANALNCTEANSWVQLPLMGAWTASGGDLAYSGFIPNVMYRPGIAHDLVVWGMSRAAWLRQDMFPEIEDHPMHQILQERVGRLLHRGIGPKEGPETTAASPLLLELQQLPTAQAIDAVAHDIQSKTMRYQEVDARELGEPGRDLLRREPDPKGLPARDGSVLRRDQPSRLLRPMPRTPEPKWSSPARCCEPRRHFQAKPCRR